VERNIGGNHETPCLALWLEMLTFSIREKKTLKKTEQGEQKTWSLQR
jgi:hypothetical protein